MTREEVRAIGTALGELGAELTGRVEEVHTAVSGRVFRSLGPAAAPVRTVHDALSGGVYAAVRHALGLGARAGGRAAAAPRPAAAPPLSATRRGNVVLGAVSGALGDDFHPEAAALAPRLAVRHGRRDVPLTPEALDRAHPGATGRVIVFLHGLCETEDAWSSRSGRALGERGATLGDRLVDDGWTPVFLRYHSGRRISDNGAELAGLLAELSSAWPVPVERLVLVGHSMGGLVARSACHHAAPDAAWLAVTTDLVCLGTPHHGAPLERAVNAGGWLLHRFPESRAFDHLLRRRSVGIKDLRYGNVRREDWDGADPDEVLRDRRQRARWPERVRLHVVAATLGRRPDGLGALAGDLLVRFDSATGYHRRLALRPERIHHLPSADHFDLLCDPRVLAILREVVATGAGRGDPGDRPASA